MRKGLFRIIEEKQRKEGIVEKMAQSKKAYPLAQKERPVQSVGGLLCPAPHPLAFV